MGAAGHRKQYSKKQRSPWHALIPRLKSVSSQRVKNFQILQSETVCERTTCLTKSKEKIPSWKATSRSADQAISNVLRIKMFTDLFTIVRHFSAQNQTHQYTYSFIIYFIIIPYFGLGLFFRFSSMYFVRISHLSYVLLVSLIQFRFWLESNYEMSLNMHPFIHTTETLMSNTNTPDDTFLKPFHTAR